MTRKSIPFLPGSKAVRRRLLLARLVLGLERVWPLLWPAFGFVCLFLFLAWCGVLPLLAWPLHALILAACVTAVGVSLAWSAEDFRWPTRREAARRLERDSGLVNRPLSEADDTLAAGANDADAMALWALHSANPPDINRLHLKFPKMRWSDRDPWRLRYVALIVLCVGGALAWHQWSPRLIAAMGPAGYVTPSVDAWIDPPAYTGVAPIYLNAHQKLSVPAGSKLNVRVHGADRAPFLSVRGLQFPWWPFSSHLLKGQRGEYGSTELVSRTAEFRVRAIGRTIGRWGLTVVPDHPPSIRFISVPKATEQKTLAIAFAAGDDYGITGVRAILTPVDGHGAPLSVDLQVSGAKKFHQTVYRDLTSHPYAGLKVRVTLEAKDAAGQVSQTKAEEVRLPQLIFTDPLARSFIELRQDLAQDGLRARTKVRQTLDALAIAPEHFYAVRLTSYLVVRDAYWALLHARNKADLLRVETLLWQAAMSLEQGGARSLADALRQLERAISQAMASGAPQEEIDSLLQRYQRTMQEYLHAMGQSAPDAADDTRKLSGKKLGQKDLDDLLTAIQTLSESGDREKAAQLMSFLQNLIENMQFSAAGQGGEAGNSPTDMALKDLSNLADQQRRLLDQTFRKKQDENPLHPKLKPQQKLAGAQGALNAQLQSMTKSMKPPSKNLMQAEKDMQAAEEALKTGDLDKASGLQKQILESLRKAAGDIAKNAKPGSAAGNAEGKDPLGRAGGGARQGVHLPDENAIRRLRDILEELRKKAGESARPQEERDYIERLLKQF